MPLIRSILLATTALLGACAASHNAAPDSAAGEGGQQVAMLDGAPLPVFTYQPGGCTVSGVLLVFHGVDRNAGPYRDNAVPLAQRYCLAIVAPLFDAARYPSSRYQRGGVVRGGVVQPASEWTVAIVPRLAAWARTWQGRADLPLALIGHSAGAQFLSRVAAYSDPGARAVVIANPSTWVRARLDVAAPYGFAGIGPGADDALRRYLAAPITVLLGREDTGSRNLATSEDAEEQGSTRFERGETVFREAEAEARRRGWAFNWRLAVVPGVGHNARRMFTSDAAFTALAPAR